MKILVAKIYVSIMVIYHQKIDSCIYGSNSQHSMLDFDKKRTASIWNISIDNCYQEIFPTFMLALCVLVKYFLTLVYLEVIANIIC